MLGNVGFKPRAKLFLVTLLRHPVPFRRLCNRHSEILQLGSFLRGKLYSLFSELCQELEPRLFLACNQHVIHMQRQIDSTFLCHPRVRTWIPWQRCEPHELELCVDESVEPMAGLWKAVKVFSKLHVHVALVVSVVLVLWPHTAEYFRHLLVQSDKHLRLIGVNVSKEKGSFYIMT